MAKNNLAYVRTEIVPESPAPDLSKGIIGWVKNNLFSSISNSIMTIVGAMFLMWVLPPIYGFLFGNAVWPGEGVTVEDCRAKGAGACWAYIDDRMTFFIYGFFPKDAYWVTQEGLIASIMTYWRVNLVFAVGTLLLVPLMWPDLKYKLLNSILFFVVYPVFVFFMLTGGVFGLEEVPTVKWGGLTVTLIIGLVGIVVSLPLGIVLALGRQSKCQSLKLFVSCSLKSGALFH